MFPDNLFQAAFQQVRIFRFLRYKNETKRIWYWIMTLLQAHTVYVPKKQPFQNVTDQLPTAVLGDEELMRVVQYRSGTNTLGIVFFCLVFGTFLGTLGEKGQVVIDFFKAVFEVIMRMVSTVMWLVSWKLEIILCRFIMEYKYLASRMTPIGITSVIAGKILGVDDLVLVMSQLAWFIVTIAIGVFLYQLVIMQLIYAAFVRKNPFKFYAGLAQGTLTAFAMASTWVVDLRTRARPWEIPFRLPHRASVNVVIVFSDLVASVPHRLSSADILYFLPSILLFLVTRTFSMFTRNGAGLSRDWYSASN